MYIQPKLPLIVTAAIIINDQKQVFLAKRKEDDSLGGYWEFPGGKLNLGERPDECLKREIKEELNIDIDIISPFNFCYYEFSYCKILLLAYLCKHKSGTIKAIECDEFNYFNKEEVLKLEKIAPADIPILNELIARGIIE